MSRYTERKEMREISLKGCSYVVGVESGRFFQEKSESLERVDSVDTSAWMKVDVSGEEYIFHLPA